MPSIAILEQKQKQVAELAELIKYWHGKLSGLMVNTPDANFNTMINTWNAFQCFTTFVWSRAASLIYCGQRNGLGYRDTVQDIQGIIHLDPEMAKERLVFMLSAQVHHGGGLPLVKFNHNAGHEDKPEDESYVRATGHPHYRADDALWLFPTVYKYVAETGNKDFLNEVIPYADFDEGTVLDHLKRAIDFSMNHLGVHGMPAGLHADWNDCLRLGAAGESSFVAMQLYYATRVLDELMPDTPENAEYRKYLRAKGEEQKRLKREQAERRNALHKELKPLQQKYAALEGELEKAMNEQSDVETQLADPAVYADGARSTELLKRFNELRDLTERLMEDMAALEEQIAAIEAKRADIDSMGDLA